MAADPIPIATMVCMSDCVDLFKARTAVVRLRNKTQHMDNLTGPQKESRNAILSLTEQLLNTEIIQLLEEVRGRK